MTTPIIQTQFLTNAAVLLYTAPGPQRLVTAVTQLVLANIDAAAHKVTINNVPPGGSVANSNIIMPAMSIGANTMLTFNSLNGIWLMFGGGQLWALADANSFVTITAGGSPIFA